jgi:site-specific DNA-methyltransferase (adenine-specific)
MSPKQRRQTVIQEALYSSRSEEWSTPPDFFRLLNEEFDFTLDPCATATNAKCKKFFTKQHNGLLQDWGTEIVFCNPPYGKQMCAWACKCHDAALNGATVVMLAHSRTDTRWFHDWVYQRAAEIRFVRGRLRFGDGKQSAPFPSLVAIFRPPKDITPPAPARETCHV